MNYKSQLYHPTPKIFQHSLLAILFFLTILTVQSQQDFRSGYVIKHDGDSIMGSINYRGDLAMSQACLFKNEKNQVIEYLPKDIHSYQFKDGRYFISQQLDGKDVFLEYLIKGELNIYYLKDAGGDHFYLEKADIPLTEIEYEVEDRVINGTKVRIESTRHIGLLKLTTQDTPQLDTRISNLKRPGKNSLVNLAEDYHNLVCFDEQCIIYSKKNPEKRLFIEPSLGIASYIDSNNRPSAYQPQMGALLHVWIPNLNEKLYFKTGILFSKQSLNNGDKLFKKIPVHIEYMYRKGFIRPKLSTGINFNFPLEITVSYNAGANIHVNEHFIASVSADFEFTQERLILPYKYFATSINVGVFLRL